MFEELLEHRKHQTTASKRSQLVHLTRAQIHANILRAIENDLSTQPTATERTKLRRRITEEYAKRPLPERTFETWHNINEDPEEPDKPEDLEDEDAEKQNEANDNKGPRRRGRPRKKRKIMKPTKPMEFLGINFDLYVKNKLVSEILKARETEPVSLESLESVSSSGLEYANGSANVNLDVDSDSELELHPDAIYANKKLEELQNGIVGTSLHPRRQWAFDRFLLMTWGWEVPGAWQDASDYSLIKLHLRSLKLLLHASILKKQWLAAYKVLTVLFRFEFVDKRAVWPLALEIITQRKQELLNLRSLSKTEMNKEAQFLDWIKLSYPTAKVKVVQKRTYQGPVYRSGSRTHAPLSIITGLWNLLVEQKYSRVREDIDDLLLHPPYATDGSYWFLLAMCCICENAHLVKFYQEYDLYGGFFDGLDECGDLNNEPGLLSSKESIKARIFSNNTQARKMLDQCDKLHFTYPKEEVEAQLRNAWTTFDKAIIPEMKKQEIEDDTEKKKTYYALKNGKIAKTSTKLNSIPEKFLYRFVQNVNEGREQVTTTNTGELVKLRDSQDNNSENNDSGNEENGAEAQEKYPVNHQIQADALEALSLLNTLLEVELDGITMALDVEDPSANEDIMSESEEDKIMKEKTPDKLQEPLKSSVNPISNSHIDQGSPEADFSDSNDLGAVPLRNESLDVSTVLENTLKCSQEVSKKEIFSSISALPTQEIDTFPETTDSQKLFRKSQFSDSEDESDVPGNQDGSQSIEDEDMSRYEDALEKQLHVQHYPDTSDSEDQLENYSRKKTMKKKKKKKHKKSAPMEMEFDFDFD